MQYVLQLPPVLGASCGQRHGLIVQIFLPLVLMMTYPLPAATDRSPYSVEDAYVCRATGPLEVWQPLGITLVGSDSATGHLLIADSRNHVIRKLDRGKSELSTMAGNGEKKYSDGPDIAASFSMPYNIVTPPVTVEAPYPAYALVADYGNACIRKISFPHNDVSTVVCGGLLTSPSDIVIRPDGNLYISDPMSHVILSYNITDHEMSVAAGVTNVPGLIDGGVLQARFNQPIGICMSSDSDYLYVADWLNNAVRVVTHSLRTVSTFVGGLGFIDGDFNVFGNSVRLHGPKSVRMIGTTMLAVSDSDNGAIRILDLAGETSFTLFGNGTRAFVDGNASTVARGSAIWGITGSLDGKEIIFTEADSDVIRHVTLTGESVCNTTSIRSERCGESPQPSILHETSYLFTTGDTGFLSTTVPRTIITNRLPPSTQPTKTVLSLPHEDFVDETHPPILPGSAPIHYEDIISTHLFLQTPEVYMDTCRIQARFSTYPSNVAPAETSIVVSIPSPGGTVPDTEVEIGCVGDGSFGTCTSTVDQCRNVAGIFGDQAWVSVRSGTVSLVRSQVVLTTSTVITFQASSTDTVDSIQGLGFDPGIYVDCPRGPLIPAIDHFTLNVYANTGRFNLAHWGISMDFDNQILEFVSSVSPPNLFSTPSILLKNSSLSINTQTSNTVLENSTSGGSVHLATITFSIITENVSQDTDVVYTDVITNILALFLVNTNNNQFVTNRLAVVSDYIGTSTVGIAGVKISQAPQIIGIHAFSTKPYVITSPDGTQQGTQVQVVAVRSTYGAQAVPVTIDSACIVPVEHGNALQMDPANTCAVNPNLPATTKPDPTGTVEVSYAGFLVSVRIQAYVPTNLRLSAGSGTTPVVNMVPGEVIRVSVLVVWEGDLDGPSAEVDVTRTMYSVFPLVVSAVMPESNTPEQCVLVVRDGFVQAAQTGSVSGPVSCNISLSTPLWSYDETSQITVTVSTPAEVETAGLVYYGDISWVDRVSPILTTSPALSMEGDTHTIMAVSTTKGTVVQTETMTSSSPANYNIRLENGVNTYNNTWTTWKGYIPVDAQKVQCNTLVVSGTSMYPSSYVVASRNLELPVSGVVSISVSSAPFPLSPLISVSLTHAPTDVLQRCKDSVTIYRSSHLGRSHCGIL